MDFLARLDDIVAWPARLYFVGETSQVFEEWRRWTTQIEFSSEVDPGYRDSFARAVGGLRERMGVDVFDESPGDVIPLPDGYHGRARPVNTRNGLPRLQRLCLYHFDPYSVAFRFIARGDEPDYHLVMEFLEHGWLTIEEMDERLAGLLKRFTRKTICQEPAEFRRRYKGLMQMCNAVKPRTTHRPTPA